MVAPAFDSRFGRSPYGVSQYGQSFAESGLIIENISPAPNSENVSIIKPVYFDIVDTGSYGVNPDATEVVLDKKWALLGQTPQAGFTVSITPLVNGYRYKILHPAFFIDSWITLDIYAEDLAPAPHWINETCTFKTLATRHTFRIPPGAFYIDRARTSVETGPVIANRFPPPPLRAFTECTNNEPYTLTSGQKLGVSSPTPAILLSTLDAPYALMNGDTLGIQIDGYPIQLLTLSGLTEGSATAAEVAMSLHTQLRGATIEVYDTTKLCITSKTLGTTASIQVRASQTQIILGFSTAATSGAAHLEEATFTATPGSVECGNAEPYAISAGDTLTLEVDGTPKTVTFAGTEASASAVADAITAQLSPSATATATTNLTKVTVRSAVQGTASAIKITGGTANAVLNFDLLLHSGTGDFADISQATAAEVAAVLQADITLSQTELTEDTKRFRLANARAVHVSDASTYVATTFGLTTSLLQATKATISQTGALSFDVYDIAGDGLTRIRVWLNSLNGYELVWDSSGSLHANWLLVQEKLQSPAAATPDIWRVALSPIADVTFTSAALMTATIEATCGASTTILAHAFVVEDWVKPAVYYDLTSDRYHIIPRSTRDLRVRFTERMRSASDRVSANYARTCSGRIAYHASITISGTLYANVIQAPMGAFTSADEGLFAASYGAQNQLNNQIFKILACISDQYIQVDKPLMDEAPANPEEMTPPSLVVSPYRLVYQGDGITPGFCPAMIQAALPDAESIRPDHYQDEYIDLTFHSDLSPQISYNLEIANIQDIAGNTIGSVYPFASWQPRVIPNRAFNLWDMFSTFNQEQDTSGDLRRFIFALQDVAAILLNEIDNFADIYDPYKTKATALEAFLWHMGNPFAFALQLSVQKQRELISLLVSIYKRKGTPNIIETTTQFFLNKTVTVKPFYTPEDTWRLGVSYLGVDSYVGPSNRQKLYSFYVEHSVALTSQEQDIIRQIVHKTRPAHTHFLGFQRV